MIWFLILLKNHIFTARSEDTIFIFHVRGHWCGHSYQYNYPMTIELLAQAHGRLIWNFLHKMASRSISTPELFSFAHDWRREEFWGTLKQASFSLVFARNKEHAHDWLIQMKSLLNALLCERRLLQYARKEKLFAFRNFAYQFNGIKRSRNTEEIV